MPLDTTIKVTCAATLTKELDLVTSVAALAKTATVALSDGTAAGQANRIFSDQRTLGASANEDLDLAGVLLDAFGDAATFARIKAIIVTADAANTNNVIVGGASSNAFVGPFGAAAHTVQVRPGGVLVLACSDATGWTVTAGTGDLLRVANSGGGSSVTYDIILIGASA